MSKAIQVKEAVKETLVGVEEPVQVSAQSKARFSQNAVKDPQSGELVMGPDEFINAVAPANEDYVSCFPPRPASLRTRLPQSLGLHPLRQFVSNKLFSHCRSTRSHASNMACSSRSPIAKARERSPWPIGSPSRTS